MRVGIFGGTFDPVHVGHLRTAEEIREQYLMDKVYFVPAYIPPHKRNLEITDSVLRLIMLKKAIQGNSFFYASDIEIKNEGVSYSINTIKMFKKKFEELYFIMGIDAFMEIDTWYSYHDIFNYTNFIVMERPVNVEGRADISFPSDMKGEIRRIDDSTFKHISGNRIYMQKVTQLDISSTKVRESVKKGRSIRYLVPKQVEKFINERKLYKAIVN